MSPHCCCLYRQSHQSLSHVQAIASTAVACTSLLRYCCSVCRHSQVVDVACIGNYISQRVACLDSHNSWCCLYRQFQWLLLPVYGHTSFAAAGNDSHHSSQFANMQCHNTRADAPSWGRAVVLAGFVSLCRQPWGYALYNRPVTTK